MPSAATREVEEEQHLNLQAFSAVDGKAALCNIFYHDPADADWAVETWHTLTAPPATRTEE